MKYLPELEEVSLSNSDYLTSKGLGKLSELKKLRVLSIVDTDLDSFTPITKCSSLQKLNFSFHRNATDKGTRGLERLTNLRELRLNENELGEQTVKRLSKLTELRELEIDLTALEELEQQDCLSALTNLTKMERMTIYGADFDDRIFEYFSKMNRLHTLSVRLKF